MVIIKFFWKILKKSLHFSLTFGILNKSQRQGQLVKRLRRRPLTAETGVRFPYWLVHKELSVFKGLKTLFFYAYVSTYVFLYVQYVNNNYDDIKKVVSIRICIDAGMDEDGITKFSFQQSHLYGKEVDYPDFNKLEAYIVRIRERADTEESNNTLIQMLEILLSKKRNREVKELLIKNHGMIMEIPGTEQEINRMCNLGEALYEDAKQEGIELGIKHGVERGQELKSKEIIINMHKKGMGISEIAELVDKDEEYVRKVLEL